MDHDDDFRQKLKQLTNVPFSDELRERIRTVAREQVRPNVRRHFWPNIWATAAGLGAAAVLAGVVLVNHPSHATQNNISRTQTTSATNTLDYPLVAAPIQVSLQSDMKNGTVRATLKNTSSHTIQPEDVFGLLAYPATDLPHLLQSSSSLTFVNGPAQPLLPGQETSWSFEPKGDAWTQQANGPVPLTLAFFQTGGTHAQTPAVVFRGAGADVSHITVHPRQPYRAGGQMYQSFEVDAEVTNHTNHDIYLNQLWGVVSFGNGTWNGPGAVRFIDPVKPAASAQTVIHPGASVAVYFRGVGSLHSGYTNEPCHVALLAK